MARRRLFAGEPLKALRVARKLRQGQMAALLGISASYLSQIESDDRPLTPALAERLRTAFPIDWQDFEDNRVEPVLAALRDAAADPLLTPALPADQAERVAEQYPAFAQAFAELWEQHRRSVQRLEIIDEALGSDSVSGGRLPWEEVRDWFHQANNYVDSIDRAAERLALRLAGTGDVVKLDGVVIEPALGQIVHAVAAFAGVQHVGDQHGIVEALQDDAVTLHMPIDGRATQLQVACHFADVPVVTT